MCSQRSRFSAFCVGLVGMLGFAWAWAQPAATPATPDRPAALAFTPGGPEEFVFDTGRLQGLLREAGKSRGLQPVVEKSTGTQMAGMYGIFSPYRMLAVNTRYGTAAWDWSSHSQLATMARSRCNGRPTRAIRSR